VSESPVHPRLGEAEEQIQLIFGKKAKSLEPKAVRGLRHSLEKTLGSREAWDTGLCRSVFGLLLDGLPHRRRSPDHERLWLNLAGYCLRPGFGYPLDDWRVGQVWGLYRQGLQFTKESQNWSEWWTFWRRMAGGLETDAQMRVFADIRDFIDPIAARRSANAAVAKKRSYEDMVRLAASLERLAPQLKIQLGEWLLERLQKPGEPAESAWALGRVGSRVPFHGSAHCIVPSATAEQWLSQLMRFDWKKTPAIGFAATLIARMSGDRERDIQPELREQLTTQMRAARVPEAWVQLVTQVQELTAAEEKRIFGEALPSGLALIN
jgi:hypothetical protein